MLTIAILVVTLLTLSLVAALYGSRDKAEYDVFAGTALDDDNDGLLFYEDEEPLFLPKNPRRVAAGRGIAAKAVRDSHGRFAKKA